MKPCLKLNRLLAHWTITKKVKSWVNLPILKSNSTNNHTLILYLKLWGWEWLSNTLCFLNFWVGHYLIKYRRDFNTVILLGEYQPCLLSLVNCINLGLKFIWNPIGIFFSSIFLILICCPNLNSRDEIDSSGSEIHQNVRIPSKEIERDRKYIKSGRIWSIFLNINQLFWNKSTFSII